MMKYSLTYLPLLLVTLALTSCAKEDPITPSNNYSVLRFEFPQGNNAWDDDIVYIHDTYGVYLLYKEITEKDLNKSWTAVPTGNLYYGDALTDAQAAYYVDFFKNQFFKYVTPEFAKNSMPIKIYMLDNLRAVPQGTEDDGRGESGYSDYFVNTRFDGFDYWAVSFKQEEMENANATDTDGITPLVKIKRCAFLYKLLVNALDNGDIVEPEEFSDGMDYNTSYRTNASSANDANYYLNRGFIDALTTDFQLNREGIREKTSNYISYWKPTQTIEPEVGAHRDFMVYVRAAMFYTKAEFDAKYNPELYPTIANKYEVVVNYFKNTIGIDLERVAKGE